MNINKETLIQQLSGRGIRPSYQRVKVLEYLVQKGGHPTVEEIFQALSKEIPSLSKVTVYNTVHTLVEAGLAGELEIGEAEQRYDMILAQHGHLVCDGCGMIFNFPVNVDEIPVEGLNGFVIRQKNVHFKGLCPSCVQQSAERQA